MNASHQPGPDPEAGLFGPEPGSRREQRGIDPASGDVRLAKVAVYRGIERTRGNNPDRAGGGIADLRAGLLTYSVPKGQTLELGQLVAVPLGRGNTRGGNRSRASSPSASVNAGGVVVQLGGLELLEGLAPEKVRPIAEALPSVLPRVMLELALWMSKYYVCPAGMVFSAVLPAAVKKQIGAKKVGVYAPSPTIALSETPGKGALEKRLHEATRVLIELREQKTWPIDAPTLAQTLGVQGVKLTPTLLKALVERGTLIRSVLDRVVSRGAFDAQTAGVPGESRGGAASNASALTLTNEQRSAVEGISATLGRFASHLLLGVTGSGKTEVYLRLIERVLNDSTETGAIVLVPEIALTPQTAGRFVQRFGQTVAVLHSGLSASQRSHQWSLVAQGKVRVVVGARSAVFAPIKKLGLIVVDEEHDHSYKQDQLPRYHGRDVAIKRAQLEGCPVILGSATPSLESYANALPAVEGGDAVKPNEQTKAKSTLWRLTIRATGAAMPRVEIVDLREERKLRTAMNPGAWRDRQLHLLGPTLESAIDRALRAGGQVILLLNRRGFANYLMCPDPKCGWVMRCDHCDATSVYHLTPGAHAPVPGLVRCHHCQAEKLLPRGCPSCGKTINTFGLGTQRVEEELQKKFAQEHGIALGSTLLRLDSDTMRTAADYFSALDRFARGEARMLVGTQMIAKGLDFPNVRLVGVVSADTALNMPDFRAAERTFQLVAQVAGRAGRSDVRGQVIVQTMNPQEPSIVLASKHDYETFARQELKTRAAAALPPIGRMARVVCRDLDLAKASASAAALATAFKQLASASGLDLRVRGPMPCPISRVADHHRVAVELYSSGRGAIQRAFELLRGQGLLISDAHTAVDVDPIALM